MSCKGVYTQGAESTKPVDKFVSVSNLEKPRFTSCYGFRLQPVIPQPTANKNSVELFTKEYGYKCPGHRWLSNNNTPLSSKTYEYFKDPTTCGVYDSNDHQYDRCPSYNDLTSSVNELSANIVQRTTIPQTGDTSKTTEVGQYTYYEHINDGKRDITQYLDGYRTLLSAEIEERRKHQSYRDSGFDNIAGAARYIGNDILPSNGVNPVILAGQNNSLKQFIETKVTEINNIETPQADRPAPTVETESVSNVKTSPASILRANQFSTFSKDIRKLLNDCICYSDCNSYYKCNCYNNCGCNY